MRARRTIPILLAIPVLAAALTSGCEKPPPGNPDIIMLGDERLMPVTEPPMPGPGEDVESWATAPWSGHPWLVYPGHVQLDVEHDLGRTPNGVLVYLSFTPDGVADGGSPGLAAGDLAQVRAVDDRHVVVWNNTNATYYARIVVF